MSAQHSTIDGIFLDYTVGASSNMDSGSILEMEPKKHLKGSSSTPRNTGLPSEDMSGMTEEDPLRASLMLAATVILALTAVVAVVSGFH